MHLYWTQNEPPIFRCFCFAAEITGGGDNVILQRSILNVSRGKNKPLHLAILVAISDTYCYGDVSLHSRRQNNKIKEGSERREEKTKSGENPSRTHPLHFLFTRSRVLCRDERHFPPRARRKDIELQLSRCPGRQHLGCFARRALSSSSGRSPGARTKGAALRVAIIRVFTQARAHADDPGAHALTRAWVFGWDCTYRHLFTFCMCGKPGLGRGGVITLVKSQRT